MWRNGSAPAWHAGGWGFESPRVHSRFSLLPTWNARKELHRWLRFRPCLLALLYTLLPKDTFTRTLCSVSGVGGRAFFPEMASNGANGATVARLHGTAFSRGEKARRRQQSPECRRLGVRMTLFDASKSVNGKGPIIPPSPFSFFQKKKWKHFLQGKKPVFFFLTP